MHHCKKRNPICFLLILSMLFFGMCFDAVQTDSFLACREECTYGAVHAAPPGLHSAGRSVSPEKAYVPETFRTDASILAPQSSSRSGGRICRSSCIPPSATDVLPLLFPPASGSDSHVVFREIISNTVIITYIHRQDGQKASPESGMAEASATGGLSALPS